MIFLFLLPVAAFLAIVGAILMIEPQCVSAELRIIGIYPWREQPRSEVDRQRLN